MVQYSKEPGWLNFEPFSFMASVLPILLILSVFHVVLNAKAQTKHTITTGSKLFPYANYNSSWSSPSGLFAFGFYRQGSGFAVGVWMVNQNGSTIVWTANRDEPPVSSNATLELTKRGLFLETEQGKDINIGGDNSSAASSAAMLDSGNFVLLNSSDHVIWQSFDYPTDTVLQGQVLTYSSQLVASKSGTDHSSGRFKIAMQRDGNLVSYPTNISSKSETAYWASNTMYDSGAELHLNHTGNLFLQARYTNIRHILSNCSSPPSEGKNFYRATLDDDGIFRLYSYNMISNTSWKVEVIWSSLDSQCQVKGFCGLNSFCQVVGKKSDCICYPGFDFIDLSTKFLGCYQDLREDSCRDNTDPNLRYNTTSLQNMWWDDHPYMVVSQKQEACKESCLGDCNCWAVLYVNATCRKYNFPLRYGKKNITISAIALFKMVLKNGGTPKATNHRGPPVPIDRPILTDNKNNIVLALALSLGTVACLFFVFAVSSFIIYKHRYHRYRKLLENANLGLADDFTLQSFSYNELERATDGFKEEIGRGSFGAVYKGILSEGNKTIAVKRLEKVVEEGVREFRAEMTTIGRAYHRNLVQLLGYCIEGSKKLLVYEFMSNGSLADLLFKALSPPTWGERVRFTLDVARGIFYLHEECGVHIILCNLKPQNILLDDTWTAKICDFGLARLLVPNQGKTSVGVEATSIGYFAPEWKKNAFISVKADIYSFGVVLLEIICCRRNIELDVSTPDEITLANWVYKCFKAGELGKLVEDEEVDFLTLERMVKVGLWCIQDDPAFRPSMKNVILMLEGTMDIPIPPSPELLRLP
ncbi:G-type lectin S-receptor-like serine/threonine-protein kinase LECRK3 [Ziziphus jujuba]|uniref:Receptor-like serine/threonine-protein kinase n=1 Tax=Ziziphus jujuba TaxID=326968 RepID=A0ABM3IT70_ZIZJJ|nr:G-type lectin S-receptor-like serine/threonine-protein kinase LECRK3 [Ziziphus jujuba]